MGTHENAEKPKENSQTALEDPPIEKNGFSVAVGKNDPTCREKYPLPPIWFSQIHRWHTLWGAGPGHEGPIAEGDQSEGGPGAVALRFRICVQVP